MTIATEITRIKTNIENAYTALEEKGATMPEVMNSNNLAETVGSVIVNNDNGDSGDEIIPEGYYKVVFVDYDGTVLSNSLVMAGSDAIAPEVPTHQGLTFTDWNRDLTNIDEHQIIGASYSIPKGTATYVVDLEDDNLEQSFYFTYKNFNEDATTEGYVDWGDGNKDTLDSLLVGSEGWNSIEVTHAYNSSGRYYIQVYYWQFLAGDTHFQGGAQLTKSVPLKKDAISLEHKLNRYESTIIPEEFKELKELYVSPESANYIKHPFFAPNLEKIVLSDAAMYRLDGLGYASTCNFFRSSENDEDLIRNLVISSKVKHITLPRKSFLDSQSFCFMRNLKTISYSHGNYSKISLINCQNITTLYNMKTSKQNSFGYKDKQNITISKLPNLKKIYNPVIEGAELNSLNSLKEVILNYPVKVTYNYSLKKIVCNFDNITEPKIFNLNNNPSLQELIIDWNKIDLSTSYSNLPFVGGENYYIKGVLDLSTHPSTDFNEKITSSTSKSNTSCLWYNTNYDKIILPSGLKTLNVCFSSMKSLKEVVFPDGLEVINMYSLFNDCPQIENVILPKNTVASANGCYNIYSSCYNLKSAVIPSGTICKSTAFERCYSLKKVWVSSNANLSYASSSNYSLFGSSSSNAYMNVKIYTDAEEKPDDWGQYWNYAGSQYKSGETTGYVDVVWGSTYEDFIAA